MITRENYEEFFLLYADDELPAETRLAVEQFVDAHPDLKEEWEALLQCRLEADSDRQFPDKDSLLRYEETFLDYIDRELDENGRKAVETLVHQDADRALELKQLMMTVSTPDAAIVFPGKEDLYRTERRRRVVMMPWLRVGAAAAVLAAVVWVIWPKGHKITGVDAPAVVATAPAAKPAAAAVAAVTAPEKNNPAAVTSAAPTTLHPVRNAVAVRHREAGKPKPSPQTTGTTPAPVIAAITPAADTNSRASKLTAIVPAHQEKTPPAATTAVAVNIPKEQSSFATQALLREAQEDRSGDMADNMLQPAGKTKLRGLFRRVTRAFGKTADRDDDGQRQVLISAFQVDLK